MIARYEANRYLVQIGEGSINLVDLDEFNTGFCSCRHFECKILPKLMKMIDAGSTDFPKAECKHITYLRKHLRAKSQSVSEDYRKEDDIVGQQA